MTDIPTRGELLAANEGPAEVVEEVYRRMIDRFEEWAAGLPPEMLSVLDGADLDESVGWRRDRVRK